jgi:hypothetical protein
LARIRPGGGADVKNPKTTLCGVLQLAAATALPLITNPDWQPLTWAQWVQVGVAALTAVVLAWAKDRTPA